MSGGNSFSRPPSRHRAPFVDVDDDDDGEPFEQDPPPGLFSKSAQISSRPHSLKPSDSPPADTYHRSSEGRSSRHARQVRSQTRSARDTSATSDAFPEGDARSSSSAVSKPSSNKPQRSLRGRALAYLSRREHSRDELVRKLTPFVEESDGEDAVAIVLDRLAQEGWLSDTRFAASVVNRRAARFGNSRIVGELKRHKVDSDTVQTLSEGLRDTEWDRISSVWARKFGTLAETPKDRAKQARFLASRGFSRDAIMRIIKLGDEDMLAEE